MFFCKINFIKDYLVITRPELVARPELAFKIAGWYLLNIKIYIKNF